MRTLLLSLAGLDGDVHPIHKPTRPTRRPWAELMKRVFEVDVLVCPHGNDTRRLIALLTDGVVVRKILGDRRSKRMTRGNPPPGSRSGGPRRAR